MFPNDPRSMAFVEDDDIEDIWESKDRSLKPRDDDDELYPDSDDDDDADMDPTTGRFFLRGSLVKTKKSGDWFADS